MMRHRLLSLIHGIRCALFVSVLSACVTTNGYQRPRDNSRAIAAAQLNQISLLLPGRYGNYQQVYTQASDDSTDNRLPLLSLDIEALNDSADQLDYTVTQRTRSTQQQPRRFLWQLGTRQNAPVLRITPRDRGAALPCEIELQAVTNGYAGQSDPQRCTLTASGDTSVPLGLEKTVLIEPGSISLADKVIRLDNGVTQLESRIDFLRIREFSGWAGIRQDGGEWQLAQNFMLHNDGDSIKLMGRDNQPLGIRLQLSRVRYRSDRAPIMRLALYRNTPSDAGADTPPAEIETPAAETLVGYAWADPAARQIGLNLDWFQVGLELIQE